MPPRVTFTLFIGACFKVKQVSDWMRLLSAYTSSWGGDGRFTTFCTWGIYSLIANLSLQGSEGGGGRAEEQWKERLAFCRSYAVLPLPQLPATRPFLFSCAETDLSACGRGQTACPEEWNPSNGCQAGRAPMRWGGVEFTPPNRPVPSIPLETISEAQSSV